MKKVLLSTLGAIVAAMILGAWGSPHPINLLTVPIGVSAVLANDTAFCPDIKYFEPNGDSRMCSTFPKGTDGFVDRITSRGYVCFRPTYPFKKLPDDDCMWVNARDVLTWD